VLYYSIIACKIDTMFNFFYFTAVPSFVCEHGSAYLYTEAKEDNDDAEDLSADLWGLKIESDEDLSDDWEASDFEGDANSDDMLEEVGSAMANEADSEC
jgi:hypothetical protein